MKTIVRVLPFLLILLFFFQSISSQGLPTARPDEVGLSAARLDRIKPFMQNYVDQGKLAGLITLIARRGKVIHFEKYGVMDSGRPMQLDAIFRIASMTKPITSTAIMMLYEEGKFQLNDPVSKFIPGFKGVKVFSGSDENGVKLEEAKNPMTIRDLLTHTSGLTYGDFGDTPVDMMYRKADLQGGTLKEMIDKLTKLPLLYQPGTKWNYSVSTDVLGYIVEVISGKPLDEFFQQRIFRPLRMNDTGFYVPKEKINRFTALYELAKDGKIHVGETPQASRFTKPPKYLGGGGRLVSTAADYTRFAQMLLNKGELEGIRLLGRKTVEFMTKNHLSSEFFPPDWQGYGFGLGFFVTVNPPQAKIIGSEGEFGWQGIYNTYFIVDPKEELVLILMTQFSSSINYPIEAEFEVLTYQAIVD